MKNSFVRLTSIFAFYGFFFVGGVLFPVYPSAEAFSQGEEELLAHLVPHRATYDIELVETHQGSQVVSIKGLLTYEWKPTCGGFVSDHHFNVLYQYADGPGVQVTSDFSTFENRRGDGFDFSSLRRKDGELYETIRGYAKQANKANKEGKDEVVYSSPEGLSYSLSSDVYFPLRHTLFLIARAQAKDTFTFSTLFDGSEDGGPVEVSAFVLPEDVGQVLNGPEERNHPPLSSPLLSGPSWPLRLAVFLKESEETQIPEYEMDMRLYENGIISDMRASYPEYTIRQTLKALEGLSPSDGCQDNTNHLKNIR